jgi:hypothetical protein
VTNVDELALMFAGDDRRRVVDVRINGVRMPLPASGTAPVPSAPRTSLRR